VAVPAFLQRRLEASWYRDAPPHPLLLPLEAAFRKGAERRRRQYAEGRKPVARLPVPVIVVGNLSVGGTGKTPLTLWLAEFLESQGYRPGIVSRGHGGEAAVTPRRVVADSDPAAVGDEPVLLARRSGRPVAVCRQRAQAARLLLGEAGCDLILADDGLQHYALARDIEIAVVDAARGFGNGHCLPAGPLREPPERLASVDLTVYTGTAPAGAYSMTLAGTVAVNLRDGSRRPLAAFAGQAVAALAGIGNPERFFEHLRREGLTIDARPFPDHHAYRPADLAFAGGGPLLMTEKDAVKCLPFAGPDHWSVPVEARLPAEFGEYLLTLLKDTCNGRKTA
jgi:tetraacyldisaccharide 4'-kinase